MVVGYTTTVDGMHRHNKIIYGQLKKIKRNKILPLIFS